MFFMGHSSCPAFGWDIRLNNLWWDFIFRSASGLLEGHFLSLMTCAPKLFRWLWQSPPLILMKAKLGSLISIMLQFAPLVSLVEVVLFSWWELVKSGIIQLHRDDCPECPHFSFCQSKKTYLVNTHQWRMKIVYLATHTQFLQQILPV